MVELRPEYETRIQSWERKTPWHRRISARTGPQGKLVLSFMFLLLVTLAASSMQFVNESRAITEEVLGAKATTIANTISIASQNAIEGNDKAALAEIGHKILASRDIVGVAFFNRSGELLSSRWQDGDSDGLHTRALSNPRDQSCEALHVQNRYGGGKLGPFLEVAVPVREAAGNDGKTPPRIVGFATVCLSQIDNAWRIGQSQAIVLLIGSVGGLVSLPLIYLLVHRIFHPIRSLVEATNRIAAGDLDAEVAIHRPDVIGTLARSFNEMVKKVRLQQDELTDANAQLATANFKLARANENLGEKVRQRTAQVEAANKRLRSEIAEKEDFLRAVSHDLTAPLRNIAGMASMLLLKHREEFDEDIIHRLERIQKNVEIETDLIGELLELSRIKTRRQKLEPVDLGELVGELAGVFEEDLTSHAISLVIETPLPRVECERPRMQQVFQNLIDNAIKYMGESTTRQIRIGCTVRPDETEFYVADSGIGIEPADIDKVFFVFRRGKSATVQAVAGKGIGLASVKSIVETYDGTIWVQSEVGKGTTFRFTINGKYVPQQSPPARGKAA